MQQYGYNNKLGTPIIQDTTVNGMGSIDMGAGSVSLGQLYIEKNARLTIDNTDMNSTDVLVNSPAPAARVYIERLTLTGKAEIGPAWIGDGEDGDATLPESPGPMLVTSIDNLKMEHGSKLSMLPYGSAVQFNQLNIKELSGTGNFYLTTSLADGISDKIHVSEHATGNFGLQVNDSGREIMTPHNTQLVYINSGDAKFNLLNDNGIVEAGVWQYKLYNKTENGHTEWFLAGRNPEDLPPAETDNGTGNPEGNNNPPSFPTMLSNSAHAIINMATAPRHILDVEASTLRQRMGDLRKNDGNIGVWARYLSDESHLNDNHYSSFRLNLNGMQIGADHQTELNDGKLLIGAFTSYSKSNIKSNSTNSGDISSYSTGIYSTWISNSGLYLDTLLKTNHFSNEVRTSMNSGSNVKGDYKQNTVTISTETGYSMKFMNTYNLTPYGKVSYSHLGGDYLLNNDMTTSIHKANSAMGELGMLLENELSVAGHYVRPYAKVAMSREFIRKNKIEINDISFNSNYSGNTGKYGIGVSADVGTGTSIYAEANYQNGNKIETPINATAGFRSIFKSEE